MSVPANQVTPPPVIDPVDDQEVNLELQTNEDEVPPVDSATPVAPTPELPKFDPEQARQWALQNGFQPPQLTQPTTPKTPYEQVLEEKKAELDQHGYQVRDDLYWTARLNELNNAHIMGQMNQLQAQIAVGPLKQDLTQEGYEVDDVEAMTALAIARELPNQINVNGQLLNVDANVRNLITRALLTGNAVITGKARQPQVEPPKVQPGPKSALVTEPTSGPVATPDNLDLTITERERLEFMARSEGVNVKDKGAFKKWLDADPTNLKAVRGH